MRVPHFTISKNYQPNSEELNPYFKSCIKQGFTQRMVHASYDDFPWVVPLKKKPQQDWRETI